MAKHSPTPCLVDASGRYINDSSGLPVVQVIGNPAYYGRTEDEDRAMLDFFTHCANSFDALVEALEVTIEALTSLESWSENLSATTAYLKAKAALAAAKKGG